MPVENLKAKLYWLRTPFNNQEYSQILLEVLKGRGNGKNWVGWLVQSHKKGGEEEDLRLEADLV
jgi:hypothetical protein